MDEIWITIKNFDKYQISNLGRIKSLYYNKIMKQGKDPHGYLHVSLYKDKKSYTKNIHIIVARTFIPNPLNLPEINHIDGNKLNCAVTNLEYCTKSANEKHAHRTGLKHAIKGEKNISSKLTNLQVKEIKELKGKLSQQKIADKYNVSSALILLIHKGINRKEF
jgi:hypothetical protein